MASVHVSTLFPKTTSDLHLLRAYDYVMLQNKARYNEGDGKDWAGHGVYPVKYWQRG